MLVGTFFNQLELAPGSALGFPVSVAESSHWAGLGMCDEEGEVQSCSHRLLREVSLNISDASFLLKSLSSNGIGTGVEHALSTIHDGRPVMMLRRCSSVYNAHHTRYRISFEVSVIESPTFLK